MAAALGVEVLIEDRLAGGLGLRAVEEILKDAGSPQRPVLVGHDPDFSELLAELAGVGELPMKKGALARVDLAGGPRPGAGVLRWLLPPDLLPKER